LIQTLQEAEAEYAKQKTIKLKSIGWILVKTKNKKDRHIYKVYEDKIVVLVVSALGHYGVT